MSLAETLLSQLKNDSPEFEPFCEFIDSFTMTKLAEISKLVNRIIKNVELDNFLEAQEVSLNPFMKFHYYLEALQGCSDDEEPFIKQLSALNLKLAHKFSGMICEYVLENQKKFKQVISKREKIHKIMRRI
jgi:hypothetical protein